MNDTSQNTSGGIGFFGLLTLLFIMLKLMGFIAWSWWWVLSPVWIWVALFAVLLVIGAAIEVSKENAKDKNK